MVRAAIAWIVVFLFSSLAPAAQGAGELALDRAAVAALLNATLPGTLEVRLPGERSVVLELGRARRLTLGDGAVRAEIPFALRGLGVSATLRASYAAEIEREDGTVVLHATEATADVAPVSAVDLSSLLPTVRLPRTLRWNLEPREGVALDVTWFLHGVRITEDRLVVEFGLRTR